MAYTVIPNTSIDSDSPLDTVLFTYLRDNDDYLKSRLVTGTGHTHNQAGTDEGGPVVPADNTVTQAKLANYAAGNTLLISSDAIKSVSNPGSWTKAKEIKINRGGTLRISFDMRDSQGANPANGQVFRNGVAVGTLRSTNSSVFVTYSEDVSGWAASDLCQIYVQSTGGAETVDIQNFRIYADWVFDNVVVVA